MQGHWEGEGNKKWGGQSHREVLDRINRINKMLGCCVLRNTNPDYPVYPFKMSLLLSPRPLIRSERSFCCGSKETAEQSECEARKHGEEESGKASSLGFTASSS
jgi:hypothetical protein